MTRAILLAALLVGASLLVLAQPAQAFPVCTASVGVPDGQVRCGTMGFCSQPFVDCSPFVAHDVLCVWSPVPKCWLL